MGKLYELTEEYANLEEWFEDEEVDEETLLDTLEGVEGEYNDKMEAYCKVIKNYEALAKAKKDESKNLANQARTLENRIAWMKKTMYESMKATGKKEAGGDILKCKIAKNGGKLPLMFREGMEVPLEYQKVITEPDKDLIRKALEEEKELDFAYFGERGESLRIR